MAAVRKLEAERDALVQEKAAWLTRFAEDNTRLAQMLKVDEYTVELCVCTVMVLFGNRMSLSQKTN